MSARGDESYRRHSEAFTIEHRVQHAEDDLERAGIRRRRSSDPPAIVFLDISGYTRLTEELGDEAADLMPMQLAALVEEAASRCGGRTIKWIGDDVELYFREPANAVVCSLELSERVPDTGLPPTHVGINSGQVVYVHGDFYGRTVNIAARIASHAAGGQVLVSDAVCARCDLPGVQFESLGPVAFKGVADEVVVFEVRRA